MTEKTPLQMVESRWTPDQLKALEAKHGSLKAIVVEDKVALFKKPSRQVLGSASAYVSTDIIRYTEIVADSCFVEGDREIIEDDDYFISAMPQFSELGENKKAELVKL